MLATAWALVRGGHDEKYAPSCLNPPTLALMISGQLSRFTWRAQSNVLVESSDSICLPVVDVYIAIINATGVKPFSGHIDETTPYQNLSNTKSLQQWFRARGARYVHVKWLSDDDMSRMQTSVENTLSLANDTDARAFIEQHRKRQWEPNLRMMYTRHVAFEMTCAQTYSMYTYWRDDNYWIEPLRLADVRIVASDLKARIVGDKHCGFGSGSDKLFIANAAGAQLLFDDSWTAFSRKMVDWFAFAFSRAHVRVQFGSPFQTERFLKHVMGNALVVRLDMKRADVRYVDGVLCATPIYIKYKCTPSLKTQSRVLVCRW